jgi:type VI secretion system secreted protein VgrG
MKATLLLTAAQIGARQIPMCLVVVAALFLQQNATANPTMVNLGTASSFAILAGSEITDNGGTYAGASRITGNVGVYSGTSDGLLANQVTGTIYARPNDDGLLLGAKNDLTTAFTDASLRSVDVAYGAGENQLGGKTLNAGVYSFGSASTANLIGTLYLDGQGDPNAVFILIASSTLVTASDSSVVLENGAQACHVFWVVDSSATLGTRTDFVGNILAYASIGLDTGATLDGRALAETAAVTLDDNTITRPVCNTVSGVPDGGNTLPLLGIGVLSLLAFLEVGGRSSVLTQNRRAIS